MGDQRAQTSRPSEAERPIREITGRLAPTLVLYAPNDLVFYEPIVRETIQKIAEAGGSVDGVPLSGPNGHLNGVFAVGQASDEITAFLAR
jgi:homoserine O-acetyltransferase